MRALFPLIVALAFFSLPAHAVEPEIADIACETTSTTGTGTIDLSGTAADGGYVTLLAAGLTDGAEFPYRLVSGNGDVEVGIGTITDAATDTVARDAVLTVNDTSAPIDELSLTGESIICVSPIAELYRRPYRVGELFWYGDGTCPAGSLHADGSAISRTTYADLFAITSTTFGIGDGSTTYNLPDLDTDDRFIRAGDTIGTTGTDENESHNHTWNDAQSDGSNTDMQSGSHHDVFDSTGRTTASSGAEGRPNNIAMRACVVY